MLVRAIYFALLIRVYMVVWWLNDSIDSCPWCSDGRERRKQWQGHVLDSWSMPILKYLKQGCRIPPKWKHLEYVVFKTSSDFYKCFYRQPFRNQVVNSELSWCAGNLMLQKQWGQCRAVNCWVKLWFSIRCHNSADGVWIQGLSYLLSLFVLHSAQMLCVGITVWPVRSSFQGFSCYLQHSFSFQHSKFTETGIVWHLTSY